MAETVQRLPSDRRISVQPTMALGMNGTEFIVLLSAAGGILLLVMLITLPLLGKLHLSILCGSLSALIASMGIRSVLVSTKRQKPEGYVIQRLLKFRHTLDPLPGVVERSGRWGLLREPAGSSASRQGGRMR